MTSFPRTGRALDYWRVNSYGYPCYFSEGEKSQEAWTTLLTFFDFTKYDDLKSHWSSSKAPRRLSSHAVESWKATFEEFGLLYVESASNRISITPAGSQIRDAAMRDDRADFAWIGLNLLLRYPLRGPRRPKSEAHSDSDLLLYRFWYAALLDLDGYLWWTELERILCRVFQTGEASDAIQDVLTLRANPKLLSEVNMPVEVRAGGFYNSLNQVAVHAGMNHLLMGAVDAECPYGVTEPKRRQFVRSDWLGMIRRALSSPAATDQCASGGQATTRLAAAPTFSDELAYFAYLGAPVTPLAHGSASHIASVELQGERVFILSAPEHCTIDSPTTIVGSIATLCQLARGQRLILSHDERWTYIIVDKALVDAVTVRIHLRRGRPITNASVIRAIQGEDDGGH